MRSHPRRQWKELAAMACGLWLRYIFLWHHPKFGGDTLTYGHLAHNLLAHHVFSFDANTLQPTLIRLPGYPAFLAGCFALFGDEKYLPVLIVQMFLDLVGCLLLARLAERLAGERAGNATLWLACLCPFTANYVATALTETLSVFCVVLAAICFERWLAARRASFGSGRWASGLGTALAFAVMLRPDQGLLAAAFLPVMIFCELRFSKRLREIVSALAPAILIFCCPILLWGVRNWRVFHVVQPLAPRYANDPGEFVPLGFQRWYRTWAVDYTSTYDTYWNYDGAALSLANLPSRAFDDAGQRRRTAELIDTYNLEQSATPALDEGFARLADERTQRRPWRVHLVLPVARVLNMWLRPRTEWMKVPLAWWQFQEHWWCSVFALSYALLNAAYLGLAVAGLLRWKRDGWGASGPLAASMVMFTGLRSALLLNLDNSEPRYTLECFPIVILLGGLWFARHQRRASDE